MEKETQPKTTDPSQPPRTGTANSTTNPPSQTLPSTGNGATGNTGNNKPTTKLTTSGANIVTHSSNYPTPTNTRLPRASTNIQWSDPIGEHPRIDTDESLIVFRRAVGINSDLAPRAKFPADVEGGQRGAAGGRREPTGMYRSVLQEKHKRRWQHLVLSWALNVAHFAQVVFGATLTALGPNAARYTVPITVLGAVNTVIAGVLALLKGQGLPERLHKDAMEFHRLQDWIEETEALLATGIIGKDRKDVGVLVESAFRKYNSAKLSEENNRPDNYVPDPGSSNKRTRSSSPDSDGDTSSKGLEK